jgi:pentatricopeptide repeat protein
MRKEGVEPDVITFTTLLHAAVQSAGEGDNGGLEASFEILREMEACGVPPNVVTFNAVLGACAKAARKQGLKMVDKGLSLIEMMSAQGVEPNRLTFNTLLSACSQAAATSRNPGVALNKGMQVITVMRSLGVAPDVISFTTLLSAGVRVAGAGDATMVSQGTTLLTYMREAGVTPDAVTYTTLINMYAKAAGVGLEGTWFDEAVLVFDKMLEEGVRPTSATCAVLVDVCHKSVKVLGPRGSPELSSAGGKIKRLKGLFDRLDRDGDGVVSVEELQASFVSMVTSGFTFKEERLSDADIVRLMKDADTDKDGKISYDEFMTALTPRAGKGGKAGSRGERQGGGLGVSKRGSEASLRRGLEVVRKAVGLLEKASKAGVRNNVVTYNALLDSCVLIAQAASDSQAPWAAAVDDCRQDALGVLQCMKAEGVVPNARSFTALVNLCCVAASCGEGDEALEGGVQVLETMAEVGVRADTVVYNSLINAAAKAAWAKKGGGGVAPALKFLEMMRQADVKPDTVTYTSLINAARHEGTEEAVTVAKAVFDKMPPASRNHRTYTVMMKSLVRVGKAGDAVALLDEAESHGMRPNAYMYRAALQAAGQNRKRRYAVEKRMKEAEGEDGVML